MARPTKLTDAVTESICAAVRLGQPIARASVMAGVSADTVRQWLQNAAEDDGRPSQAPFVAFARCVEEAMAVCEHERLKRIQAAGQGGAIISERTMRRANGDEITEVKRTPPAWQSDAWLLERRYSSDYALRSHATQTHELSDSMIVLIEHWHQLRDHPPALPAHDHAVDAETAEGSEGEVRHLPGRPDAPGDEEPEDAHTFRLLDRVNRRGPASEANDEP
jgi:hypothetical protein